MTPLCRIGLSNVVGLVIFLAWRTLKAYSFAVPFLKDLVYISYTVGKNARSSKTKMYKQKSDELSIITIRYMHKAKKTTPVPDLFLK